jgi:hypothetical protein
MVVTGSRLLMASDLMKAGPRRGYTVLNRQEPEEAVLQGFKEATPQRNAHIECDHIADRDAEVNDRQHLPGWSLMVCRVVQFIRCWCGAAAYVYASMQGMDNIPRPTCAMPGAPPYLPKKMPWPTHTTNASSLHCVKDRIGQSSRCGVDSHPASDHLTGC